MVFHLSHIDLDGYFCQYLSSKIHPAATYFNINYPDVTRALSKIERKIKEGDRLIITDLNLKSDQVNILDRMVDFGIDIEMYDHHISDVRRPWMIVDKTRSASRIFAESNGIKSQLLRDVDNYDLWRQGEDLEKGAALTELVNRDWLWLSDQERAEFHIHAFGMFEEHGFPICDSKLVENFLSLDFPLIAPRKFLAERYAKEKPIEVSGGRYVISFEMSSFQYYSSEVLNRRPDLILVNISSNGGVSFRSREQNVEEIARFYFSGGGHRCAAGGYIGQPVEHESEAKEIFLNRAPRF